MKRLSKEQIRILEKNKHYYESLKSNGTLNKISSVTIQEFATIYNDVYNTEVSIWCMACVVEIIEVLYINYEQHAKPTNKQGKKVPGKPATEKKS